MKSFVFVLFLSCLCLAEMDIVYLKEASIHEGAVCLDGSPSIYFFKPGSAANSTKWVLHILGGGFCFTEGGCVYRSQTPLGSSLYWPSQMLYGGPISENATFNPDFYDWNHAFFAYCDGFCFSGDRDEPVEYQGKKLYFRGHRILLATMKDLLKNKGLDKATDVLVVGDSAGGMATFYHIDEIKSMMPKSVTRFKAAPLSGIFLNFPNIEGKMVFGKGLKDICNMQNCTGGLNKNCVAAMKPEERYKCMFAENSLVFTESLIMPIGSAYDWVATSCIVGGEFIDHPSNTGIGNCSAVPGWEACEKDPSKCTKEQWAAIEAYGTAFMTLIENNPKFKQDGNGLYEYNCHSHSIECTDAWMLYSTKSGKIMRDAVRDWFFSDNEPTSKNFYKDCVNHESYSCNPSCKIPVL